MERQFKIYLAACLCLFFITITAADEVDEVGDPGWDYKGSTGPDKWGDSYPLCNGQKQSPINIDPTNAWYSPLLSARPINFQRYDLPLTTADEYVHNNGHTVVVHVNNYRSQAVTIFGGGLPSDYELAQFHWHWGSTNTMGSEHTFDGKSYPMEVHFVHFNKFYNRDADKIRGNQDGIAVVGVFIEVGAHNPAFDAIVDSFTAASLPGANDTSHSISLPSLRPFLPNNTEKFYRYDGSLTTPPCFEAVIWTVMRDTITISQEQLDRFRTGLKKDKSANRTPSSSNQIKDNFRPTQPLNGRQVLASYSSEMDGVLDVTDLHDHHWGYYIKHGKTLAPHQWGLNYQQCTGKRQSPIHIRHSQSQPSPQLSASPWKLTNYESIPDSVMTVMENNGHTVVIQVGQGIKVSGGGLPAEYSLAQFHWHWGRHNSNGSEHMLDDNQYPAEIHLVHTNTYYGKDMTKVTGNPDGLAVLGAFIQVGEHNKAFEPIIEELEKVKYMSENEVNINLKSIRGLLPEDMSEFYRYQGSLTTPPCWEIVIWTVFRKPITISQAQLDYFRTKVLSVADPQEAGGSPSGGQGSATAAPSGGDQGSSSSATEYAILDNFRPVQDLNFRVVKYAKIYSGSVNQGVRGASLSAACWLVCLALLPFIKY